MDLVERAARLHARALSQSERSRFDLADRGLRRALEYLTRAELDEQPGALAVKVRVLTTLSTVEVELSGQRAGGLDPDGLLAQAQLIAEQLADPGVAFAVENAIALQALRRGDHEVALLRFEAAERHVADASVNDASVFYLNRGNLRLQRLELSTARRDFDRCIALAAAVDGADASKMKVSEFMARHNLGYLEFLA